MSEVFNELLVRPIVTMLVAFYHLFAFLHVPNTLGFSIIALTIAIRFLLSPLIASQLRASKKMQEIAPQLGKLKEKHKGDARRMQEETAKLYKENNINPAAGCLPVVVQLPIIWALYFVSQKVVGLAPNEVVSQVNKLVYFIDALQLRSSWDPHFFGVPLGQNPSQLVASMPVVLLIPVITGLLQFLQSKMMVVKQAHNEPKKNDFASAFQTQSLYMFPVMIGIFSYTFPVGISLYWNTFTIFGILQQRFIQERG